MHVKFVATFFTGEQFILPYFSRRFSSIRNPRIRSDPKECRRPLFLSSDINNFSNSAVFILQVCWGNVPPRSISKIKGSCSVTCGPIIITRSSGYKSRNDLVTSHLRCTATYLSGSMRHHFPHRPWLVNDQQLVHPLGCTSICQHTMMLRAFCVPSDNHLS